MSNYIERLQNFYRTGYVENNGTVKSDLPNLDSPNYKVVLLIGQSNAAGCDSGKDEFLDYPDNKVLLYCAGGLMSWKYPYQLVRAVEKIPNFEGWISSPDGVTFATHFAKKLTFVHPNSVIVIIPVARGNTGFSTGEWSLGGYLRELAVSVTNRFLSEYPNSELEAMIWHQGERDIDSGTDPLVWRGYVEDMIKDFRTRITNASKVPFIAGQVSRQWGSGIRAIFFNKYVSEIFKRVDYADYASSENCEVYGNGNEIHFNDKGIRLLAERYFSGYLACRNRPLNKPTTVSIVKDSTVSNFVNISWDNQFNADYYTVYVDNKLQQYTNLNSALLVNLQSQSTVKVLAHNIKGYSESELQISTVLNTLNNLPVPILTTNFKGVNSLDGFGGINNPSILTDETRGKIMSLVGTANQGLIRYNQVVPRQYTFSAWVKVQNYKDNPSHIFAYNNNDFSIIIPVEYNIGFGIYTRNQDWYPTPKPFLPKVWVHIAAVHNADNQTMELYQNGRKMQTFANAIGKPESIGTIFIGLNNFGYGGFDGYIDDFRLYNLPLTEAQVAQLYQETLM